MEQMNIKYFPYIIFQCSWGIIQTLAGLIMCLISYGEKHMFYKGSVATFWNRTYGISLGLFIFIPPQARFYNADKHHFSDDEIRERLVVHEKENCYKMMLLTGSKKPETLHFYEKAGYNSNDKTAFIQWI